MITPLAKLKELLLKNKLDAILVSSISNITYLTNYSGFSKDEREAYLFITKNSQYILTDGRYATAVKTLIPDYKLIEISRKQSVAKIFKKLVIKHKINTVGFEGDNISHLEHKKLVKIFSKMSHIDVDSIRVTKSSDEISKIEKACKLGDKTFEYILKIIHLGISEKEMANEIEIFIKKQGADVSFLPLIAFGENSAKPHHLPTAKQLDKNSIILLDFGIKLNDYCSDMSRTIFFGSANAELKKMYNTVLEAQRMAINSLIKQMSASKIDKIVRNYIISQGYKTIPHGLGHGIGLKVHEGPRLSAVSKDILKEGMVFSVEPGIYIPNFGGVRIEDLVVLTKNGPRILTHSPKTLIII